ncbi:hypothetical protein EET67_09735 [Pseudaminobacter arsenicus]|uniref:Uncharacterized protein n=1 Tax=Borborobacter arsenicus TaxID=1851146 RepID=A0A432V6Y5_9HYPH|nr:hypothetical protein [Pseudaminobacter arsenicus]RUM97890.1 hypothetical protein EET67_09735 [Pseudaminobacter arsenicus]
MKSRLSSSILADRGARLAGVFDPFRERAARPEPLTACPPPPGHAETAALSPSSSGDRAAFLHFTESDAMPCEPVVIGVDHACGPDMDMAFVRLSDHATILLRAIAAYEQCSADEALTLALATHATKIGAGPLARAVLDEVERNRAAFARDGDLTDLPAFNRTGDNRFRSGGP